MATSRTKPSATRSRSTTTRIARPPKGEAPQVEKSVGPARHLTPTDDPNVFINAAGMLVDEKGVWVGYAKAKETEEEAELRILGEKADTPAKVMKRIALDPTLPLVVRLDAAKSAAPYYDKKTPVALETKTEDFSIDLAKVAALPRAKRIALLDALKEMGVDLGAPK